MNRLVNRPLVAYYFSPHPLRSRGQYYSTGVLQVQHFESLSYPPPPPPPIELLSKHPSPPIPFSFFTFHHRPLPPPPRPSFPRQRLELGCKSVHSFLRRARLLIRVVCTSTARFLHCFYKPVRSACFLVLSTFSHPRQQKHRPRNNSTIYNNNYDPIGSYKPHS